jgi:hypothetical protein
MQKKYILIGMATIMTILNINTIMALDYHVNVSQLPYYDFSNISIEALDGSNVTVEYNASFVSGDSLLQYENTTLQYILLNITIQNDTLEGNYTDYILFSMVNETDNLSESNLTFDFYLFDDTNLTNATDENITIEDNLTNETSVYGELYIASITYPVGTTQPYTYSITDVSLPWTTTDIVQVNLTDGVVANVTCGDWMTCPATISGTGQTNLTSFGWVIKIPYEATIGNYDRYIDIATDNSNASLWYRFTVTKADINKLLVDSLTEEDPDKLIYAMDQINSILAKRIAEARAKVIQNQTTEYENQTIYIQRTDLDLAAVDKLLLRLDKLDSLDILTTVQKEQLDAARNETATIRIERDDLVQKNNILLLAEKQAEIDKVEAYKGGYKDGRRLLYQILMWGGGAIVFIVLLSFMAYKKSLSPHTPFLSRLMK